MFLDDIRRAVMATPRHRLADLSAAVWKGFAGGAVSETDAQALAELIEARKAVIVDKSTFTRVNSASRRSGSRPRSSASMQRRRSWSASGWLPPNMASAFTTAELAALAVVIKEIATRGSCGLPAAAIAGRAGVGVSSARNAVREARKRGILSVEERRVAYDRSLPNRITIASRELNLWVRTRARVMSGSADLPNPTKLVRGGGVKFVRPTTNHYLHSPARPAATAWKAGTFGEANRKVLANRPALDPRRPATHV